MAAPKGQRKQKKQQPASKKGSQRKTPATTPGPFRSSTGRTTHSDLPGMSVRDNSKRASGPRSVGKLSAFADAADTVAELHATSLARECACPDTQLKIPSDAPLSTRNGSLQSVSDSRKLSRAVEARRPTPIALTTATSVGPMHKASPTFGSTLRTPASPSRQRFALACRTSSLPPLAW